MARGALPMSFVFSMTYRRASCSPLSPRLGIPSTAAGHSARSPARGPLEGPTPSSRLPLVRLRSAVPGIRPGGRRSGIGRPSLQSLVRPSRSLGWRLTTSPPGATPARMGGFSSTGSSAFQQLHELVHTWLGATWLLHLSRCSRGAPRLDRAWCCECALVLLHSSGPSCPTHARPLGCRSTGEQPPWRRRSFVSRFS